jgi:predicted component of type VI protein secretion system
MAYLQIETRDSVRRVPLERDRASIGRLTSNDIVLASPHISRYHAELQREGGTWWITDLHSTNGVQIGGRRVDRHPLGPGERVQLAPGITVYLIVDEDAASLDPTAAPTAQMPAQDQRRPAAGAARLATSRVAPAQGGSLPAGDQSPYTPGAKKTWLPPPRVSPWPSRGTRPEVKEPGGVRRLGEPAPSDPMEGDLFRRHHAPTAPPAQARATEVTAPTTPLLHLCQTCGQLTAPHVINCQSCHNSIAQPCQRCGLSLLPIQDRCPRCHAQNTQSVYRSRRTGA